MKTNEYMYNKKEHSQIIIENEYIYIIFEDKLRASESKKAELNNNKIKKFYMNESTTGGSRSEYNLNNNLWGIFQGQGEGVEGTGLICL